MSTVITDQLKERCNGICELCNADDAKIAYAVSPKNNDAIENEVAICNTCLSSMDDEHNKAHWQCLIGSIWNTEFSVQALSYRLLYQRRDQDWARDTMDTVELDETVIHWALSSFQVAPVHRDSNGTELSNGDTVILTQVLNVKGVNFMAPKGTIIRKIRLVPDDTEHIEGKINEQTIVILTKYVRKTWL